VVELDEDVLIDAVSVSVVEDDDVAVSEDDAAADLVADVGVSTVRPDALDEIA